MTDPAGARAARAMRLSRAVAVAVAGGLTVMVAGTFLPWLRTGSATRNSFRAAGLIDRLLHPPGIAGLLLSMWPGVVLLCAVAIAMLVLGLRRAALAVATVVALAVGAVSVSVLLLPARSYVAVAPAGPIVAAAGAGTVVIAGSVWLAASWRLRASARRSRSSSRQRPSAEAEAGGTPG